MNKFRLIFSRTWWIDALKRAGRTALTVSIPFFPVGVPIGEANWSALALVASLAGVSSLATSLAGLPETVGDKVPWWQAALVRMLKSFGQGVVTGIGAAILLTDVDWGIAFELGLAGAVGSFILSALSSLPETGEKPVDHEEVEIPEDAEIVPVPASTPEADARTTDVVGGYLSSPTNPPEDDEGLWPR